MNYLVTLTDSQRLALLDIVTAYTRRLHVPEVFIDKSTQRPILATPADLIQLLAKAEPADVPPDRAPLARWWHVLAHIPEFEEDIGSLRSERLFYACALCVFFAVGELDGPQARGRLHAVFSEAMDALDDLPEAILAEYQRQRR